MEQAAFSVGPRVYTWRDVVAGAVLRGDWSALEQQTRQGLALVQQADQRNARPSEEEIDAAGQEFRYERDLITAEEMEAWLGRFGITVDDWMDYVERSLLRKTGSGPQSGAGSNAPNPEEPEPDEQEPEEIAQSMVAEAVCSGALSDFAQKLAARAAIADRAASESPGAAEAVPEQASAEGPEVAAAFERLGLPSPGSDTVAELTRLERTFDAYAKKLVTPAAVRAQIEAHRLDWIRLDFFSLTFEDEAAAREAWLCLEEDGVALNDVAANAHIPVERVQVYLSDLDASARPGLLSAEPGELVGPLAFGDRFHLFLLRNKFSPSEENPDVRRRAEDSLQQRIVEQELAARVRWQEPA